MIDLKSIDNEIRELMGKPMTPGNIRLMADLRQARKCVRDMGEEFTEDDAKAWVAAMKPGAKWTMEQTSALMASKGYSHRPCEFWVVMNMLYSDYGKMLARYNADKPEVYADMADAFLTDPDAAPHKVGRYWREIVAH